MITRKLSLLFFLPLLLLAGSPLSKTWADYAVLLADDSSSTVGKSSRHALAQFREQLRIGSNRLSSSYAPRFSRFRYLIEDLAYSENVGAEPHVLYIGLPSSYLDGKLHYDFDGENVSIDAIWQELAEQSSELLLIAEMPPQAQRTSNIVWPSEMPSNLTFIGVESSTNLQSADSRLNHPYASDFALTFFLVLAEAGQDQQRIGVREVTELLINRLGAEYVWTNADRTNKKLSLPTFIATDGSYYSNWLAGDDESRRERELAAQKAKEAEDQRKRELAAQRAKEAEEQRKRELSAQRAREAEAQRKRELAAQRAREAEEQRQRELTSRQAKEAEEQSRPKSKMQRRQEQEVATQEGPASELGGSPEVADGASTVTPNGSINPQLARAMARLKALEEEALRKEKELEELNEQKAAAKKKRKNTTSFGF